MIRFKFGEVYAREVKKNVYEYELIKINKVYILIEKFFLFNFFNILSTHNMSVLVHKMTSYYYRSGFSNAVINKTTYTQGHILF